MRPSFRDPIDRNRFLEGWSRCGNGLRRRTQRTGQVLGLKPQSEISTPLEPLPPVCLDGCSAFGAEERAALGDGPPYGVDDERESRFRDLARCRDGSVRGASSGLGLDFGGHGLPPVTVGASL